MRNRKLTTEEFVSKAQEVHGDRYDYSETTYLGATAPLRIICKDHGAFMQLPYVHVARKGNCPKCVSSARIKEAGAELVRKLREWHGDRYDLSEIRYTGVRDPVILVCPEHGRFSIQPMNLLAKHGCPACGTASRAQKNSERTGWAISTEEFIAKCHSTHGTRYDYSKSEFIGRDKKVEIYCEQHGPFWQRAIDHIKGQGCPACGSIDSRNNRAYTTEEFLAKVRPEYRAKYDFSLVAYNRGTDRVKLVCPTHGEFTVVANRLISAQTENPCPECCREASALTTEEFISLATEVHGDAYDYSQVSYHTAFAKVSIICKVHGVFHQRACLHLAGQGCRSCNQGSGARKRKASAADKFTSAAQSLHGLRYDYSRVDYQGVNIPVTIGCPEHGDFLATPGGHLHGSGCRKCASGRSGPEKDLSAFLTDLGVSHELRDRTVLRPKELDLVIPGNNLAIEYCGLYWHRSENPSDSQLSDAGIKPARYHLDKLDACEKAGYRLLTIFEDEWLERRAVVENLLKRTLLPDRLVTVGARKCEVKELSAETARQFYDAHHLAGFVGAKQHLGLEFSGELLAVGSFTAKRVIFGGEGASGEFELVRFAQKSGMLVHGALNKLVTAFSSANQEARTLISYVDRRWFTGASYFRAGFGLDKVTPPGYWYVLGQTRSSRFAFARHNLEKKLRNYDPALSEKENMLANGYSIIYDCGTLKLRKEL